MRLEIPSELQSVFDRYRGTGRFTVGAVSEFVKRWNTMKTARSMDLREWISYVADMSVKNGLVHGEMRSYIDGNIDLWIDIWRNADDGMVHFSKENVRSFADEGLLEIVYPDAYDYSETKEEDRKMSFRYDLVKFIFNEGDDGDEGKGQIA